MEKNKVKIWRDALNSMKGNLLTKHAEHKLGGGQPEGEGVNSSHQAEHDMEEPHEDMHNQGQGAADPGELPTEGDDGDEGPAGEVEEPEGAFHEGPGNAPELKPKSRLVAHMKGNRKK